MKVTLGRIYRYYPNSWPTGRREGKEIVRVIGTNSQYVKVKCPGSAPYNFAHYEDFGRATKEEIQEFVERMPLK